MERNRWSVHSTICSKLQSMNTSSKTPLIGPRRFQWQTGGWFGSIIGSSAWMIPTAFILGSHRQIVLALLPAGCFLLINVVGVVLWHQRDRIRPFPALIGVLTLLSVVTPLVWLTVASQATEESVEALNWPSQPIAGLIVLLICPAIVAWIFILEYSHQNRKSMPVRIE